MSYLGLDMYAKNLFFAAVLNFTDKTGSRFSKARALCPNRGPT